MKPVIGIVPQTFIVRQDLAQLVGKLICKLAPVSISCLEKNWVRSCWGETVYRHWLVVNTFRRCDLDNPIKGLPDKLSEMGSDIRQQRLDVIRLGTTPVALGYFKL